MTEAGPEENQQELFQEFSKQAQKPPRFPSIARTQKPILITATMEQLLLGAILLVLFACLFFFLGVLRGRAVVGQAEGARPQRYPAPAAASASARPSVSTPAPAPTASAAQAAAQIPKLPAPAALKPYTIQLVTYKKQEFAKNEVLVLRRSGFDAMVVPSGAYFLVCAGQYANKEDAARDLQFFSKKYKGCFLRRR